MSEPIGKPTVTGTMHGITCADCVQLRAEVERLKACLEPGTASAMANGVFALAQKYGQSPYSSESPHSYLDKKLATNDPVFAASLATKLKEECEHQHARAEQAEADLARVRAVIEELIAYGMPPHIEAGLLAALEGRR